MFTPKAKERLVVVIKHPRDIYLVRGRFFRAGLGLQRTDINSPRSKDRIIRELIHSKLIVGHQPLKMGPGDYIEPGVTLDRRRYNLRLLILHASADHIVRADGQLCTLLRDHSDLDRLFRTRIERTQLAA